MANNEASPSRLVTLLAAVSATGAGGSFDLGDMRDEFSLLVATTGSPTFSVTFQGSEDGTNWFTLGTAVTSVTNGTTVTGTLARYVRANLTALSGGTLTAELAFSLALGRSAQVPAGSTTVAGVLQLDGTATDIQPLGTQAAGSRGQAADAQHVHPLPGGFYPSDAGYLEWNYDPAAITASTGLTTAATVYLIRINIRVTRSVTNVVTNLGTLGSSLASGCFAGLYAGTTAGSYTAGQLIGTSTDQVSVWNTGGTTGLQTVPLTGAPFTVPPGFVWAALMFHGTTGPSFSRWAAVTAATSNIGFTATTARFAAATGAATLPSSLTVANNSLQSPEYWAALS